MGSFGGGSHRNGPSVTACIWSLVRDVTLERASPSPQSLRRTLQRPSRGPSAIHALDARSGAAAVFARGGGHVCRINRSKSPKSMARGFLGFGRVLFARYRGAG